MIRLRRGRHVQRDIIRFHQDLLQRQQFDAVRGRFRLLRETLAVRIQSGQQAGRIAADMDPLDAAALVIAASDGLQIQWLLDPGAVDVERSLSILERLLPRDPGLG